MRSESRFFLLLAPGLVLGAIATWLALGPRPPAAAPTPASPAIIDHPSSIINSRLQAADAAAAIAAWRGLRAPDGSPADFATRAESLRALLLRLPAESLPRLHTVLAADASSARRRLLHIGFDAWVEQDPASAARWAVSARLDSTALVARAVQAWAELDAKAASDWACSLPDPALSAELAGRALASLAEKDPARAVALANSRDDAFRQAVFRSIVEPLGKADPAAAVQAYGPLVWKNGNGYGALKEVIGAWAARDPRAAIDWLIAQPTPQTTNHAHWLVDLANTSGNREAVATAIANTSGLRGRARHDALEKILFVWGTTRPADALAWLDSLQDPDLSARLLADASTSYPTQHPEQSLPLALALPEGAIRAENLARILAAWTKLDSAAALAWIEKQTDPGVVSAAANAHATLLGAIAEDEPATALAEWRALANPQTRAAALLPIAYAWGKSDPAAALAWYSGQKPVAGPDSPQFHHLTETISLWAKKDVDAALRWTEAFVLTKPADDTVFPPRLAYFGALVEGGEDPPREVVADLYSKIQDSALRSEALGWHVRQWLARDPAAANAWLKSQTRLSPAETAALAAP